MDLSLKVFKTLDGARLRYYWRKGPGPVVVLAHPHSGHLQGFMPLLDRFAGNVLLWDRRGYGGSTRGAYAASQEADLVALLDHLGIETVTLIGIAAGGASVAGFASCHPERVLSLGFACSFMGAPHRFWQDATGEAAPSGDVDVRELSQAFCHSRAGEIWRAQADENKRSHAGEPPQPAGGDVAALAAQEHLYIATGDQDLLFTPTMLGHAKTLLPQAHATVFAGAAHAPHVEQPTNFAQWITGCLNHV